MIKLEQILNLAFQNRSKVLVILAGLILLVSAYLTFDFFSTKKKARLSADIATGFAFLDEGKKELALFYFEKSFNESQGFYRVISGVGVIKSLSGTMDEGIKIINVLKIIRLIPKDINIKNLLNSVYFSRNKNLLTSAEFEQFQKEVSKSKIEVFKQNIIND